MLSAVPRIRAVVEHLFDEPVLPVRLAGVQIGITLPAIVVRRSAGRAGRTASGVVGCHPLLRCRRQVHLPRLIVLRAAHEGHQEHKHRCKPHEQSP
jgi:hypothetical protein